MNNSIRKYLLLALLFISGIPAKASHMVGADFTYTYQGDTIISGTSCHKYQVTLCLFEDCQNGEPEAIAQDDPAFFAVFTNSSPYSIVKVDSSHFASSVSIPATGAASPCGGTPSPMTTCLLKKTFVITFYLVPNTVGYVISYQRCCRNAAIANIADPGNDGATYYCTIPPSPAVNNSAVFSNYPPQIVCVNLPLMYDNSATDADGDSLSYGFCPALLGASSANIKPFPIAPPYDTVPYISPFSSQAPFTGSIPITIDPVTGMMTGTPNQKGRFLVTVFCNEWRSGTIINTTRREFEFIVDDCTPLSNGLSAGNDTTILTGDSVLFNATGGHSYSWSPHIFLSDTSIGNPIGYFPVAGDFTYTLTGISDSGCASICTRTIHVLDHGLYRVANAFTPNGDNVNDYFKPFPVLNATLLMFRIFDRDGQLLYSGDAASQGWDGTYKGRKMDIGCYLWELTYIDNKGITRSEKGNVTLIR